MIARGADVEVVLEPGRWSPRWPALGIAGGPFVASIVFEGGTRSTDQAVGVWTISRGEGHLGAGAVARWRSADGALDLELRVPDRGSFVHVSFCATAPRALGFVALRPLAGPLAIAPSARRLVNGYQSWDYAGVRPAAVAGSSWWTAAFASDAGAVVLQALGADRFATEINSCPAGDSIELDVRCGATPAPEPVPGSWGFVSRTPNEPWLVLDAGTRVEAERIVVGAGRDPLELLEDGAVLAGRALGAKRWQGEPICGWESWYHYGSSITPEAFLANGRLLRERWGGRFRLLQLDDGWQRAYGDWRPNERWPRDLGAIAEAIREIRCAPGLWLAPFMIQPGTAAVRMHAGRLVGEPSSGASLTDSLVHRHALDATHPDALEWLRALGRRVCDAGFVMVKLDFLYLGALEGRRHDRAATGTEALRRGLAALVEGLGDAVYVLACGAPILPVAGLCHGNRVGGDLAAPIVPTLPPPFDPANGAFGIRTQARNVAARFFLHRRLFEIDPDVVMAAGGDEGPPYSVADVRALATIAALAGGPFLLADDLAALPQAKRAVLEDPRLLAWVGGDGFRPLDLFEHADEPPGGVEHFFAAPSAIPRRWSSVRSGERTLDLATTPGSAGTRSNR